MTKHVFKKAKKDHHQRGGHIPFSESLVGSAGQDIFGGASTQGAGGRSARHHDVSELASLRDGFDAASVVSSLVPGWIVAVTVHNDGCQVSALVGRVGPGHAGASGSGSDEGYLGCLWMLDRMALPPSATSSATSLGTVNCVSIGADGRLVALGIDHEGPCVEVICYPVTGSEQEAVCNRAVATNCYKAWQKVNYV